MIAFLLWLVSILVALKVAWWLISGLIMWAIVPAISLLIAGFLVFGFLALIARLISG